ncbi:MAG: hypothetical protein IJ654_10530 [Bacteroidales bacterium]|nr:hypothetical protein [Bacteroidales bacterium]
MTHATLTRIARAALTIIAAVAFCGLFAEAQTIPAQLAVWAGSALSLYLACKGLSYLGTFKN